MHVFPNKWVSLENLQRSLNDTTSYEAFFHIDKPMMVEVKHWIECVLQLLLDHRRQGSFRRRSHHHVQWMAPLCVQFTGLGDGEIFKTYCDGTICDEDDDWSFDVITGPGNGIVVIGRSYTNLHNGYAGVELDELLFFNRALEVQEVEALYQQYAWLVLL